MMKPALSLIVPVYKAELFIASCLNSVFSQMPDGVEVILVNDGTPDRSMDIVRREFFKWIDRGQLVLIEQANMGPGAARNAGLLKSRSKFIAFLDSDDVLLDGYFTEVLAHVEIGKADIIEFGFKRFWNESQIGTARYDPLYSFSGLKNLSEVRESVFAAGRWFPSTRVYRREIFDHFRFPEGTHYEDLILISEIYLQDFLVEFVDKPLLGYRYNPASITSNHTVKNFREISKFYKSIPTQASESEKILKLKVARSLVFFGNEMKLPDFDVSEIVRTVRKLELKPTTRSRLGSADRMFLELPGLYATLDAFRVPAKKLLARMGIH